METEYLLNVGIEIASTEFESFCSQELSLSTLFHTKRLKAATALVQFGLELIGGTNLEVARVGFKPAPGNQCILNYHPSDISTESVLDDMASPLSELLFYDFVMYLGQRAYLQGDVERARASRRRSMAKLREFGDDVSKYADELTERHRAERESLPSQEEPGLPGIYGRVAAWKQGIERQILEQFVDTLEWYFGEYAEFPQLVSGGIAPDQGQGAPLGYAERKILDVVSKLRAADMPATDDAVAAKLPLGPKGKMYTRETVNRYRRKMRGNGIDV